MLLRSNMAARSIVWNRPTTALSLTGLGTSASNQRVQVCRLRWPAKKGIRCDLPLANQIRSCPRNCRRRALLQSVTGPCTCRTWEGGEELKPASQETCLNKSSFRRAGRAHGAVFRCDDVGVVTRTEGPPCNIFCAIFQA